MNQKRNRKGDADLGCFDFVLLLLIFIMTWNTSDRVSQMEKQLDYIYRAQTITPMISPKR